MKPSLVLIAGALTLGLTTEAMAQGRARTQTTTPQVTTPQTAQPTVGRNFVDADGDGICDNYQARANATGARRGYGPRNGTGNQGVGPRDGTGYGARAGAGTGAATGTSGQCDRTGPKGAGPRWRR